MAKIANGADLMLPGIITDESKGIKAYCEGLLEKGDLVSINLTNNIAPIAVGRTHRSSEDMYMAVGRGKGVDIIHSYGDQLWTAGSRVEVPSLGVPSLPHQQKEYVDNDEEDEEDDDEVAKEEEELASLSSKLEEAKISQKEPEKEEPEDTRDPVVVMDELMDNALPVLEDDRKENRISHSHFKLFQAAYGEKCPSRCGSRPEKVVIQKTYKISGKQRKARDD